MIQGGMVEQLAQILRLLGDETRLRILVLLSKHPLNVSESVSYTHLTLPTTPYV